MLHPIQVIVIFNYSAPTFVEKGYLKMKRIISMLLVLVTLSVLAFPTLAESFQPTSSYEVITQYGHPVYCQSTDEYNVAFLLKNNSMIEVSFAFTSNPNTVYVYDISLDNNARVTNNFLNTCKDIAFANVQNAKKFTCRNIASPLRAGEQLKKNAVIAKMKRLYGEPYSWKDLYTDDENYLPLIITIRQDLYYSAERLGATHLPIGVTIATAAVSLASALGAFAAYVTLEVSINIICAILGVYDVSVTLVDMLTVESYRGVACTYRTGTVTPRNGSEIPKVTASRTYSRIFCIDENKSGTSSDYANYLVDSGKVETIYAPSEYSFNYLTMIEDTYNAYIR